MKDLSVVMTIATVDPKCLFWSLIFEKANEQNLYFPIIQLIITCVGVAQIMEPLRGFEPRTYRLQGGCSTTELKRRRTKEQKRTQSTSESL